MDEKLKSEPGAKSRRPRAIRVGVAMALAAVTVMVSSGAQLLDPLPAEAFIKPIVEVSKAGEVGAVANNGERTDVVWMEGSTNEIWTRSLNGDSPGLLEGPLGYSGVGYDNRNPPQLAANQEGTMLAWETWESSIVWVWKPRGTSQFPASRSTLCEPIPEDGAPGEIDRCNSLSVSTQPGGTILAMWLEVVSSRSDRLMMATFDPARQEWAKTRIVERSNAIIPMDISLGPTGEITAVWKERHGSYDTPGFAGTRLADVGSFGEPMRLVDRLEEGDWGRDDEVMRVAVGESSSMVIVGDRDPEGYGNPSRVPFFVRPEGSEGFSPRRDIEFSGGVASSDVAATDDGQFVLAGLMEQGVCLAHRPMALTINSAGDQFGAARWLRPNSKYEEVCEWYDYDVDVGDYFGDFELKVGWEDRVLAALWVRNEVPEMALFNSVTDEFTLPIALSWRIPESATTQYNMRSSRSILGVAGEGYSSYYYSQSPILVFGCQDRTCEPGVSLGRPVVERVRTSFNTYYWDGRCIRNRQYYKYRLSLWNTGNVRVFGVRVRYAIKGTGRRTAGKRWTRWRTKGSIDAIARGRVGLLLPAPPRGSKYRVLLQVKANGVPKSKSVAVDVRRRGLLHPWSKC